MVRVRTPVSGAHRPHILAAGERRVRQRPKLFKSMLLNFFPHCELAWGPDADRHANALIILRFEKAQIGAHSRDRNSDRSAAQTEAR